MDANMKSSILARWRDLLVTRIHHVCLWWWREFTEFAPHWLLRCVHKSSGKLYTICIKPNAIEVINENGDGVEDISFVFCQPKTALSEFIRDCRIKHNSKFGLRLSFNDVFHRQVLIPVGARKALDEVLAQDLVCKLPFTPDEVFQDHIIDPVDGDPTRLKVQHLVVRKAIVESITTKLGLSSEEIDFVDGQLDDGRFGRVHLTGRTFQRPDRKFWAVAGLCCALLLFSSSFITFYVRQGLAINRVTLEDADLKPKVMRAQQAKIERKQKAAVLSAAKARKTGYSVVETLEALSKFLPDGSWVQNIRIREVTDFRREVSIVGYSDDAVSLVNQFDSSRIFENAQITSAVLFDAIEKRERFTLKALTAARLVNLEATK